MDSFPQFAAELETEEAISIPLSIPTSPFSPTAASPSREIFVRPRGGNIIAIVEKSSSNGNTDTEWKYLNLENDFVLPLHVASELNRPVWKVRVGYFQGGVWDDYPFHTRDGAFKFQQLVTGYKPVETFENVTCLVTYKAGLSLRRPQYAGFGTVQVWREADKTPKVPVGGLSMMSSRSSGSSQSLGRPTSIASIQSNSTLVQNYEGQSVLVVQKPRPPLLVAFLKDKSSDEAYASLKVDISALVPTKITREKAILMLTLAGSTFQVDKHARNLPGAPLASWNLCNLGNAKARSANSLRCEYLSLDFGSGKDPANVARRDELYNAILRRQLSHITRESRLGRTRDLEAAQQAEAMRAPQVASSPSPSVVTVVRSAPVMPVLPRYDPQPWISTTFITAPYEDPRFGKGSVTVELDAAAPTRGQSGPY